MIRKYILSKIRNLTARELGKYNDLLEIDSIISTPYDIIIIDKQEKYSIKKVHDTSHDDKKLKATKK